MALKWILVSPGPRKMDDWSTVGEISCLSGTVVALKCGRTADRLVQLVVAHSDDLA